MFEIERRAAATQATERRFRGKPFDWSKSATCIHLLRYHAHQMGHDVPIVPRFRTALGAKKALKAAGHDTLPDLLDSLFVRVPPAFTRVGDVIAADGEDGLHGIMIRAGNTMSLGWHEDAEGCTIIDTDLTYAVGGWRL